MLKHVLAGLLAAAIGATGAAAQAPTKRVALLLGPLSDKYIAGINTGYTTQAKAEGLAVTTFSTPFDAALQAQQIDQAVAQKFDMLVVQTVSQKAAVPPLTRAKAAGIPIVTVVVPLVGDDDAIQTAFAGANSVQMGQLAAEGLVKVLGDRKEANVAIVSGALEEGLAPLRLEGFKQALSSHPGLKIVATEDAHWNPVAGEQQAGQMLARFASQGGIDAMWGMNDTLANAVVQAAQSAGIKFGVTKGTLAVVGGNCQQVGVRNIEAGRQQATVLNLPIEEGKLAAEISGKILAKKPFERMSYVRAGIITKANIAEYAKPCSY